MKARNLAALLLLVSCFGCSSLKRFGYEGFDRDGWQQPERVVSELGLEPGSRVADLGAGGGYFTFRLADAVGPTGRVYAVDVDADMIEYLKKRAADGGYENVEVIHATPDDPGLLDGGIDLLFTCNTYHHIENRADYFGRLLRDLKLGGRVAILELNGASWFSRWFGHNTPGDEIVKEMRSAGYRVDREFTFIDRQSFLILSVGR